MGLMVWLTGSGCGGCEDLEVAEPWQLVDPFEEPDLSAPRLLAQERVDFGDVPLDSPRLELIVLRNAGDATLTIHELRTSGPAFDAAFLGVGVGEGSPDSREIAPGEALSVRIIYTARSEERAVGELLIFSDDPRRPKVSVALTANVALPCLTIAPQRLDLGTVEPASMARASFRITSCSSQLITSFELDTRSINAPDSPFRILEPERYANVRLNPNESLDVEVAFRPDAPGEYSEQYRITSDSGGAQTHLIDVYGQAREPGCPSAVIEATQDGREVAVAAPRGTFRGIPLDTLSLSSLRSRPAPGGGPITNVEWSLVRRPSDSGTRLAPSNRVPTPMLFLDLAGEYTIELHVWDASGTRSCEPARLDLIVIPDEDLHVQLVWDTPNDPDQFDGSGSDVDLHLLREGGLWNESPWDCSWLNVSPDWGVRGALWDDPSLDRDDTDGWGPENINLNNPEEGQRYHVGVHYFSDQGYGASFATVRLYIRGELTAELSRKRITDQQLWHALEVRWPDQRVIAHDTIYATFPQGVFRP